MWHCAGNTSLPVEKLNQQTGSDVLISRDGIIGKSMEQRKITDWRVHQPRRKPSALFAVGRMNEDVYIGERCCSRPGVERSYTEVGAAVQPRELGVARIRSLAIAEEFFQPLWAVRTHTHRCIVYEEPFRVTFSYVSERPRQPQRGSPRHPPLPTRASARKLYRTGFALFRIMFDFFYFFYFYLFSL